MGHVFDLLADKGCYVHAACQSETVLAATQLMNEHRIGAVVVMNGEKPVGMFTERDVLRRVVAEQRDPSGTMVGDVMSRKVICCTGQTTLDEARSIMRTQRIRHLPVVGAEGQIIGMISIGDLNAWSIADGEATIHYMSEYIYGRV